MRCSRRQPFVTRWRFSTSTGFVISMTPAGSTSRLSSPRSLTAQPTVPTRRRRDNESRKAEMSLLIPPPKRITATKSEARGRAHVRKVARPGTGARKTKKSSSGKSTGKHRAQMASFVSFDDDGHSDLDEHGDEASELSQVDAAGVRRVIQHEQSCHREPEPQGHNNPGFDVLSRDADGNVLRRIEIKSIGGPWTGFGVWMSAKQWEENQTCGDEFWLYVVENAEDDDAAVIHRIQNPASKATNFGFDLGWQALREADFERDDSGNPLVTSTRRLLGWGEVAPNPDHHD